MDSQTLVDPDLMEPFHRETSLIQVSAKTLKQTLEKSDSASLG